MLGVRWITGLSLLGVIAIVAVAGFVLRSRIETALGRLRLNDILFAQMLVVIALAVPLIAAMLPYRMASFTLEADTELLTVTIRPLDRTPKWPQPKAITALDTTDKLPCMATGVKLDEERSADFVATFIRQKVESTDSSAIAVAGKKNIKPSLLKAGPANSVPATAKLLVITLASADDSSLGSLICADGSEPSAPSFLRLSYPATLADGSEMTVPAEGIYRVGGDVSDQVPENFARSTPLLLNGLVTMDAASWPLRTGRVRTEVALHFADVVSFEGDGRDRHKAVSSTGTIRATAEHIRIVVHTEAETAVAARRSLASNVLVAIAPGIWTRATAMNEWAVIVPIVALVIALLRTAKAFVEKNHE